MDIGVFIPIGNNGWLISTTAPQYRPSFALNQAVVQKAEQHGLDFALSMIKLRGFGGATEFWDHNLESFTLMAGIAATTSRIRLYASVALLTIPPAIVARMAVTIDSIAPGRFGVNIVSGWQKAEYEQMGAWPGDWYFANRYDYSSEYVEVMHRLWTDGAADYQGKYFTMTDCRLSPRPSAPIRIVAAGQSERGMRFAAEHADYNFVMGIGVNTPAAHAAGNRQLLRSAAVTGRDVGSYVLFMIITAENDAAAEAKWQHYRSGVDTAALAWMAEQGAADTSSGDDATARRINLPDGAVNLNIGTLVGSYATVARLLDEAAAVEGSKGIMLIFDDFLDGLDSFGRHVQPLMQSRRDRRLA